MANNLLNQKPLKVTIIWASKEFAENVTKDLLAIKTKSGKDLFKRVETETGFKVKMPMNVEGNEKPMWCTVLEYKNENGAVSVRYDDRVITTQNETRKAKGSAETRMI